MIKRFTENPLSRNTSLLIEYVEPHDNKHLPSDGSILNSIRARHAQSKKMHEEEAVLLQAKLELPEEQQRREAALLEMAKQRGTYEALAELADLQEARRQRWKKALDKIQNEQGNWI